MPFVNHELITLNFLKEVSEHFPNDTRIDEYRELFKAIRKMNGCICLHLTTTTPISDEVTFEGLCRRFVHQLRREVLGKRAHSHLPIVTIMERGNPLLERDDAFHAHIIIGSVIGETRSRSQTDFRHYLSKKTFPSLLRILKRLTYPVSKTKVGRIGACRIEPVDTRNELPDYLLKGLKMRSFHAAWMATTMNFKNEYLLKRSHSKTHKDSQSSGVSRFHRA